MTPTPRRAKATIMFISALMYSSLIKVLPMTTDSSELLSTDPGQRAAPWYQRLKLSLTIKPDDRLQLKSRDVLILSRHG